MRKVISTIIALSFAVVFGAVTSFAQIGTRIEADIPFDFTVGKKTFAPGKYQLLLTRTHDSLYSALLVDSDGRHIFSTFAVRNGRTLRGRSEMIFADTGSDRFLETIKTPDSGFAFSTSIGDKRVAEAKRVSVPTSASTNFD